jgi:Fe-S cluster biogenesis protein NfuA
MSERTTMKEIKTRALNVIHNLNWLLESHESSVELVDISGNKVFVRCIGYCAECESDCVGVAFKERMPEIELIMQ